MKFLGKFISLFDAVFKKDVTLDGVSTGTIASGANLGLDSNNKIVKNTISGGTTDLTSDVTGVLPIANGGTNSNSAANARTALGVDAAGTDNSTNVTLAGSLDYITLSGQEITRNAIALADDVSGFLPIANGGTAANNAAGARASLGVDAAGTDNSTNVTLAGTPDYITISGQEITRNQIDLTADVTGVLPVGNTAAKVTSIVAGDGIDVSGATGDVTVTAETATDSNPGVVELATTAEADTGTDTARAITAAGLKSHVDKRYSYQYLTWEVNTNSFTSTNYEWPAANGGFGSEEFTTNTSIARNTSIVDGHVDTPTYSAAKNLQHMGWYVPHACQLVGVSGAFRNNGSLQTPRDVAVFVGTPDIGSTATPTYTQRAFAAGDVDGGQANSRTYTTNVTLATPFDLVAGNVVMPAVCDAAGNNSVFMQGNFSIIIRTLII